MGVRAGSELSGVTDPILDQVRPYRVRPRLAALDRTSRTHPRRRRLCLEGTIPLLALSLLLSSCGRDPAGAPDAARDWNVELLESAAAGDVAGIAGKLAHGADPNHVPDPQGTQSPLMNAVKGKHSAAVRLLLQRGALPNLRLADETPLYAASGRGSDDIVRSLVQSGANVNARIGFFGREDALSAAVQGGHGEIVWILYAEGAQVAPWHLCVAVRAGSVAVVNALMNAQLDPRRIRCGESSPWAIARKLPVPQRDEVLRRLDAGVFPKGTEALGR